MVLTYLAESRFIVAPGVWQLGLRHTHTHTHTHTRIHANTHKHVQKDGHTDAHTDKHKQSDVVDEIYRRLNKNKSVSDFRIYLVLVTPDPYIRGVPTYGSGLNDCWINHNADTDTTCLRTRIHNVFQHGDIQPIIN